MISRRNSLSSRKSRLQRLENRRLLASDLAVDLISDVPDTAYFSRAVPLVALDAAQVVEPVGGSRPTESGEGQLNIEIIPGLKLRSSPAAMAAVERAAAQWEAHLFDPITVSIEIDFDVTSGGVLGFAIPTEVILSYSEVRAAMQVDGLAETDDSIVERLPDADSLDFALPNGTEFLGDISIAKANAKAINLRTSELDDLFGVADGGIVMSESASFDFNNADGVEAGQVDFESVVVHEIGHILGFLSSVDRFTTDAVPDTIQPSTLDLFRFRSLEGADNPRSPAGFEAIQRELRPSTPAVIDFLLQDGWDLPAEEYPVELGEPANVLPPDSTNPAIPFGYQASHWQDSDLFGETIGVMAPTIPPQTVVPISNIDLRAMDLIGYDVLPPNQVASVPELNDDQAVMNGEDRIVLDVLANDRNDDLPFQLSTFQIVDPPLLGEVTLDPVTGLVVYEVEPGTGDDFDIFTYTVANSEGIYGDPAIVEITISGVGERPFVIDDFVLTRQNQPIDFNPLANDTDDGELVLSNLAIESGPYNGTVIITSDGLRYTPSTDFIGNDTFDYSITDSDGLRSEGTVEITVGDMLIPPVVPGEPLSLLQRADVNRDQSISALDALLTINYLNRRASATTEEELSDEAQQLDVSGDGNVTAVDALMIINLLNESDVSGEPIQVPVSDHSIHDGLTEEDELVGDDAGALF